MNTITCTGSFTCECSICSASDSQAVGMSLFTKKPVTVTTQSATPAFHRSAGTKTGNGYVRKISERQERYIKFLIKERDISNLHLTTNQSIDADKIAFMGLPAAKALIEKLLGCPIKGTDSPVKESAPKLPGSPKQIVLINKLAKERNLSDSDIKILLKAYPTARLLIDKLFGMPKDNSTILAEFNKAKTSNNEEFIPATIIPGFYRNNNETYKVQFNQAKTNLYALRQIGKNKYEYVAGAIRQLTPEMFVSINPLNITLEEAKAYGRKTGKCYMCGRTLTNKTSIEEGIGPYCRNKF